MDEVLLTTSVKCHPGKNILHAWSGEWEVEK